MIRIHTIGDVFLIAASLVFWLSVSEFSTGAPSTLINYYFADFNSSTTGHIIRSHIQMGRLGAETYDIKYGYFVSEKYHTSDQVSFSANGPSGVRNMVEKYPVGKMVTVFYDKSNPMLATLEVTPLGAFVWVQVAATIIMWFVSIVLLPLNSTVSRKRSRLVRAKKDA